MKHHNGHESQPDHMDYRDPFIKRLLHIFHDQVAAGQIKREYADKDSDPEYQLGAIEQKLVSYLKLTFSELSEHFTCILSMSVPRFADPTVFAYAVRV